MAKTCILKLWNFDSFYKNLWTFISYKGLYELSGHSLKFCRRCRIQYWSTSWTSDAALLWLVIAPFYIVGIFILFVFNLCTWLYLFSNLFFFSLSIFFFSGDSVIFFPPLSNLCLPSQGASVNSYAWSTLWHTDYAPSVTGSTPERRRHWQQARYYTVQWRGAQVTLGPPSESCWSEGKQADRQAWVPLQWTTDGYDITLWLARPLLWGAIALAVSNVFSSSTLSH